MSLSQDQASENLKEIERTARRSAHVYGYANSSPFFVLWGVIWMVGYGASDLAPKLANLLWIALLAIGVAGSLLIGRRQKLSGQSLARGAQHASLRFFATFLALGLFIVATYAIFGHASGRQQAAFVPLIWALIYSVTGIWKGPRFLAMGVVVAVLTLGGFFFLRDHYLMWMALVGGGALVLGGLWMRTV
jgi:hypothetical protein